MTHRKAVAGLFLVAFLWGISFPLTKLALAAFTPLAFLSVRFTAATLIMLLAARGITREELKAGAVLGLLFWAGFVLQTVGLDFTTPSRSAFITSLSTPVVPVAAFLLHRTVPPRPVLLGIAVAALGVYLLTDPGAGGLNQGDWLTVGCALIFGVQIVAVGFYSRRQRIARLLLGQLAVTAALSLLAAPLFETPRMDWNLTITLAMIFLIVTGTWSFYFQLQGQSRVSSSDAALIYMLEPLFAAVASYLVMGEVLHPTQWLGGGLILAGTVVPELRRGAGAPEEASINPAPPPLAE